MVQQARNLLMDLEDVRTRVKFFLHDRDASLTGAFDEVFRAAGAREIRCDSGASDEFDHGTDGSARAAASRWTEPWCGISGT
jgi:hypothetical protein